LAAFTLRGDRPMLHLRLARYWNVARAGRSWTGVGGRLAGTPDLEVSLTATWWCGHLDLPVVPACLHRAAPLFRPGHRSIPNKLRGHQWRAPCRAAPSLPLPTGATRWHTRRADRAGKAASGQGGKMEEEARWSVFATYHYISAHFVTLLWFTGLPQLHAAFKPAMPRAWGAAARIPFHPWPLLFSRTAAPSLQHATSTFTSRAPALLLRLRARAMLPRALCRVFLPYVPHRCAPSRHLVHPCAGHTPVFAVLRSRTLHTYRHGSTGAARAALIPRTAFLLVYMVHFSSTGVPLVEQQRYRCHATLFTRARGRGTTKRDCVARVRHCCLVAIPPGSTAGPLARTARFRAFCWTRGTNALQRWFHFTCVYRSHALRFPPPRWIPLQINLPQQLHLAADIRRC